MIDRQLDSECGEFEKCEKCNGLHCEIEDIRIQEKSIYFQKEL